MKPKSFLAAALALALLLSATPTALAHKKAPPALADNGPEPYVADLAELTRVNPNFRTAIWTGHLLQLTVMNIPAKGEVGLEIHEDTDQFLYVVEGTAKVFIGAERDKLCFRRVAKPGSGIFIPAGHWHNIVNKSAQPLKMFSVYAPPHHPHGTIHETKDIADAAE
jgi:mannose-6-phosphate isomerase-like protein (cupin superfamily)